MYSFGPSTKHTPKISFPVVCHSGWNSHCKIHSFGLKYNLQDTAVKMKIYESQEVTHKFISIVYTSERHKKKTGWTSKMTKTLEFHLGTSWQTHSRQVHDNHRFPVGSPDFERRIIFFPPWKDIMTLKRYHQRSQVSSRFDSWKYSTWSVCLDTS